MLSLRPKIHSAEPGRPDRHQYFSGRRNSESSRTQASTSPARWVDLHSDPSPIPLPPPAHSGKPAKSKIEKPWLFRFAWYSPVLQFRMYCYPQDWRRRMHPGGAVKLSKASLSRWVFGQKAAGRQRSPTCVPLKRPTKVAGGADWPRRRPDHEPTDPPQRPCATAHRAAARRSVRPPGHLSSGY